MKSSAETERNLYLITGSDELMVHEKAARLFQSLTGGNDDPFGSDVLTEGENGASAEQIYQMMRSLQSPSFLGGRKIIWLKHFSGFSKGATSEVGKALKEFAELLKNQGLPPDVVLLMDGPGADARSSLYKICSKIGEVQFWDRPDPSHKNWQEQVRSALDQAMREQQVLLTNQAFGYLVDAIGGDTARIPRELEKIWCWRNGDFSRPVDLSEVQMLCHGKGEEVSWSIGENLAKRDLGEMLRLVDVLISQNKNDEGYSRAIFSAAAGFFTQGIRIKLFMAQRRLRNANALKTAVEQMSEEARENCLAEGYDFVKFHPYRVLKLAEQGANYSASEMIRAIVILRDTLFQITVSGVAPRMGLENALVKMMSGDEKR